MTVDVAPITKVDEAMNDEAWKESVNVRLTAMEMIQHRIMNRLDEVYELLQEAKRQEEADSQSAEILDSFSIKGHVAVQMVMAGKSNRDIAEVLEISEDGAKVHVRSVAKKLHVSTRSQIVNKLAPLLTGLPDAVYQKASGGLPKNWISLPEAGTPEDPYRELYLGKRTG